MFLISLCLPTDAYCAALLWDPAHTSWRMHWGMYKFKLHLWLMALLSVINSTRKYDFFHFWGFFYYIWPNVILILKILIPLTSDQVKFSDIRRRCVDIGGADHWSTGTSDLLMPLSWHQSCFLSSSLALFFLPFKSFLLPFICLSMMLWLTGGGCSRQMLKCLVWSGFTRRRATRDSPMNSLCVSLSSSHTDTLGWKEGRERGVAGRKRRTWIKYAGLGFGNGF